jgi:hypothetical protein
MRKSFERAGNPLLIMTYTVALPGFIEVYAHPALVELAGAAEIRAQRQRQEHEGL